MSIRGIGAMGNPAWREARKAERNAGPQNTGFIEAVAERAAQKKNMTAGKGLANQSNSAAAKKGHTVYMKTDDMLYSGGNGTGLSYYIKYAEGSTEDDPTVIAKGMDENGEAFEQTIHINEINPKCATAVEMSALEAYLGVEKKDGLSSLPMGTGTMGLHDRRDFMKMFHNAISDMKRLSQKKAASYYQYSMQAYWDFMK